MIIIYLLKRSTPYNNVHRGIRPPEKSPEFFSLNAAKKNANLDRKKKITKFTFNSVNCL